ncbi:MAG: methyltransferase, partial [Bacteroidales bacterium]
MPNPYFRFKQFTVWHDRCAMKVGTDSVLLGAWADVSGVNRILDVGTGTGLMALMLAQRSAAIIDAIEPDYEAYLQAGENISRSPWSERVLLYNTTLQEFQEYDMVEKNGPFYDLLVTNPPYFSRSEKAPDKRRMLSRHTDSLNSNDLLNGAEKLLTENGKLCLILPAREAKLFIEMATAIPLFCTRELNIKPLPDREIKRVLLTLERK